MGINSYFKNNPWELIRRRREHTNSWNKILVSGTGICYWFFWNRDFAMNGLFQELSFYILLTKENRTWQDSCPFWQECFDFQTVLRGHSHGFCSAKSRQFPLWQGQWRITSAKFLISVWKLRVLWLNCTCIHNTK